MHFSNFRKRRKALSVELTPLIDVVFLLLIFFMVATTFDTEDSGLKVELPHSKAQELVPSDSLKVFITKEGKTHIQIANGSTQEVERGNLEVAVSSYLADTETKNVVVAADKGVDYGVIIEVMNQLKESGVESVDLDTTFYE